MANPITGHLTIQPVREGRFELRDRAGVTVGTFQHEDHAKALADAYNGCLYADLRIDESQVKPVERHSRNSRAIQEWK